MFYMVDCIKMKDLVYTIALALGTMLIIMAMTIGSLGYLWHLIKPTVEAKELQYLRDTNLTGE